MTQLLDRDHVFAALEAVNEVLKRKYLKETVMITGGAALMFLFDNFYRSVKDISAGRNKIAYIAVYEGKKGVN